MYNMKPYKYTKGNPLGMHVPHEAMETHSGFQHRLREEHNEMEHRLHKRHRKLQDVI